MSVYCNVNISVNGLIIYLQHFVNLALRRGVCVSVVIQNVVLGEVAGAFQKVTTHALDQVVLDSTWTKKKLCPCLLPLLHQ